MRLVGSLFLLLAWVATAHSAEVTFLFEGQFNSSSMLFDPGDTFSGHYTVETTTPTGPIGDSTLNIQANAIVDWSVDVESSVVPDFSIGASLGQLAIGNDTAFGDRYIATNSGVVSLPLGLDFVFLQLDLQDPNATGADMLSDELLGSLPDLLLANSANGRFFIDDPPSGCSQCFFQVTSLTIESSAVPDLRGGGIVLLGLALLGAVGVFSLRRRLVPR